MPKTLERLLNKLKHGLSLSIAICLLSVLGCMACVSPHLNGPNADGLEIYTDLDRFPLIAALNLSSIGSMGMDAKYFWLDNERLIMSHTLRGKTSEQTASFLPEDNTIVVWNIRTNQVTTHMQGHVRCVDGTTSYVQIHSPAKGEDFNRGFPRRYLMGEWRGNDPQLTAYSYPYEKGKEEDGGNINNFSCRFFRTKERVNDSKGWPLYEGHGRIQWSRRNDYKVDARMELSYINPKLEAKSFTILWSDFGLNVRTLSPADYFPWTKAYLFQGIMTVPDYRNPRPKPIVHLLKIDGSMVDMPAPDALWEKVKEDGLQATMKAGLSQAGFLWLFESRWKNARMNGIYLQEKGRLTRFLPSLNWAMSPDGCRIASKYRSEIKVLQMCKTDQK